MWIIPLIILGAIVVAAASRSPRETLPSSRQLAPPSGPPGLPGPISVLGEILRIGQAPSPTVILCAIAEAEAIGRRDLASDIVQAFVAPVVYQHEKARRDRAMYARGSCALPSAPRAQADHERGSCAPPRSPRAEAPRAPAPSPLAAVPQGARQATEEEILAMLHADPKTFLAMATSRRPSVVDVPIEAAHPAVPAPPVPPPLHPQVAPSVPSPPIVAPPPIVLYEAADQTRAMAPGSPLGGVPDDAWREFVARLARESPLFASSRHVGQYRQRRERLAELGIDPSAIGGSAAAQRTSLDADLADAHHHAAAGGVITEHLGRAIAVPGHEGPETITLSGLLGVIQCAGLEGAVGWLEKPSDRKRYPHTTQTFLRTNGVF